MLKEKKRSELLEGTSFFPCICFSKAKLSGLINFLTVPPLFLSYKCPNKSSNCAKQKVFIFFRFPWDIHVLLSIYLLPLKLKVLQL